MDISTQRATEPRLATADLEIVILAGSLLCGRGCERTLPQHAIRTICRCSQSHVRLPAVGAVQMRKNISDGAELHVSACIAPQQRHLRGLHRREAPVRPRSTEPRVSAQLGAARRAAAAAALQQLQ